MCLGRVSGKEESAQQHPELVPATTGSRGLMFRVIRVCRVQGVVLRVSVSGFRV